MMRCDAIPVEERLYETCTCPISRLWLLRCKQSNDDGIINNSQPLPSCPAFGPTPSRIHPVVQSGHQVFNTLFLVSLSPVSLPEASTLRPLWPSSLRFPSISRLSPPPSILIVWLSAYPSGGSFTAPLPPFTIVLHIHNTKS